MRKYLLAAITVALVGLAVGCKTTPTATPTAAPTSDVACIAIPPVTEDDWVRGPADASITLIEYADFQ